MVLYFPVASRRPNKSSVWNLVEITTTAAPGRNPRTGEPARISARQLSATRSRRDERDPADKLEADLAINHAIEELALAMLAAWWLDPDDDRECRYWSAGPGCSGRRAVSERGRRRVRPE